MIQIEGVPWIMGFANGRKGGSLYEGYQFYCSGNFLQYERGWKEGTKWDNGYSANGEHITPHPERTEERREQIIDQVKYATSKEVWEKATLAAIHFDPTLASDLMRTYPLGWKAARKQNEPNHRGFTQAR